MSSFVSRAKMVSELVVPWQALTSYFWLFSGILSSQRTHPFFQDWTLLFVLVAIFTARSAGMCINRCVDKNFDAKNPRTKGRALPSKRISFTSCVLFSALFLALFWLFCSSFPLCGKLSCIWVTALICLYSYTKRFTFFCHFVLGAIHGTLPVVGSIWACYEISFPSLFLGIASALAISGTDILYALSDEAFDKKEGLYSIPARFGSKCAIKIAFMLHLGALFFITLCMTSFMSLAAWSIFLVYCLLLWGYPLKNEKKADTMFAHFFLLFSGGSFFSLLIGHVWKALL